MGKRILVCGTRYNSDDIIRKLSPLHKIVGYTDCSSKLRDYTIFDGYNYKKFSEYLYDEYDYIVISYSSVSDIESSLNEFSKVEDRCIVYEWFKEATIVDPLGKYKDSEIRFEQLIFGMSHSQVDIQTQLLDRSTFKFSLPSMDLFCHYHLLKRLSDETPDKLCGVKNVIIELPYYIFNYDLSRSVRSAKKRLYYFKSFQNFHNYGKNREELKVIEQFEKFLDVFQYGNPRIVKNNSDERTNPKGIKSKIFSFIDQKNVIKENSKVWVKKRENTLSENRKIFSDFIELLKLLIPDVNITVLVCPFNPLFILKNRKYINYMRDVFYDVMKTNGIHVVDDFYKYHNPFAFNDYCHLNIKSAYLYTTYIKEEYKW